MNYFTCSCTPRAIDMDRCSARCNRCFMTVCQSRSLFLATGAVRNDIILCLTPRGTATPGTSKSKSDLKKNKKMLLFREHVRPRTSAANNMFRISIIRCSTHQTFMHVIAGNKRCMKYYTEELHCSGKVIITRLIRNKSE
jgi:hypothetical protein